MQRVQKYRGQKKSGRCEEMGAVQGGWSIVCKAEGGRTWAAKGGHKTVIYPQGNWKQLEVNTRQ